MIRRLGVADLAAWKTIRHAALRHAPHAFGRTMEGFRAQSDDEHRARLTGSSVFAAFDGDKIVGSAAWHRLNFEVESHRGKVSSVFVMPEARGTGLADALLAAIVADARGTVLQLELEVDRLNPRAVAFYRRNGFVVAGTVPRALCHDGVFIDEHLMIRRLDG